MASGFAQADQASRDLTRLVEHEAALTRGTNDLPLAPAVYPRAGIPNAMPCQSGECANIITGVNETWQVDPVTGRGYYNLLPPSLMGSLPPDSRVQVPPEQIHRYDPMSFPSFVGKPGFSVSAWARNSGTTTSYLIAKNVPGKGTTKRCWNVGMANRYLGCWDCLGSSGNAVSWNAMFPEDWPSKIFGMFKSQILHHNVWVWDMQGGFFRGYLDGMLIDSVPLDPGFDDCPLTEDTYIGFMSRYPGLYFMTGEVQDTRLYDSALSDADVALLAGDRYRECSSRYDGQDSAMFTDAAGHPCSWFQQSRKVTPKICLSASVRAECPMACNTIPRCPSREQGAAQFQMWNRVMHLKPPGRKGILCAARGIDPERECRAPSSASIAMRAEFAPDHRNSWHPWAQPNLTDCKVVSEMLSGSCSFDPVPWVQSDAYEFTFTFWFRSVVVDDTPFVPVVMLLHGLQPLRPLT